MAKGTVKPKPETAKDQPSKRKKGTPGQPSKKEPEHPSTDLNSGDSKSRVSGPADQAEDSTPAQAQGPPEHSTLAGVRLPATSGSAILFGGPKDRSAKPDDKLALPTGLHSQYERVRSLNARGFYCAMRWDYRQEHMSTEEGKRWWANRKLLVTSAASGKSVVVRAVDFGPHENTGHVIGLSPGAAEALNIEPGDQVEIAFADQRAQPGVVSDPERKG
jgi:hypothetical protein